MAGGGAAEGVATGGAATGGRAAGEPAIDPAVIDSLRRLGDRSGRDVVGELTALFLHTADAQVAQAHELVARADLAELARVAHALKGSSSVIGGRRVASAAAALELACHPGDQSPGDVSCARVALQRLVSELEAFRSAVLGLDIPS
jgi:HPt (histidine-containing phosphotransfer) domain-containing protein